MYTFLFQFPILFLGETEIKQNLKDDLNNSLSFLETFLSGSKWVAGDNYTIADTAIYASVSSILVRILLNMFFFNLWINEDKF